MYAEGEERLFLKKEAAMKGNSGKNVVYICRGRRPPDKRLIEIDKLFQTLHLGFVSVCLYVICSFSLWFVHSLHCVPARHEKEMVYRLPSLYFHSL